MQRVLKYGPRVAIFLAGMAAGALAGPRREGGGVDPAVAGELKDALAGFEKRLAAQEAISQAPRPERPGAESGLPGELKSALAALEKRLDAQAAADAARFTQLESRLDEHAAKLADVPSTSQIVAAMEQLLSKTMSSLDGRLTSQANSIEILKTTVSQTDGLLERVLESLDSLQTYTDPSELRHDAFPPAV